MEGFVLPLFPAGSLSSSVLTTVWVGVFVVCLFNLRFGWVLSGLVVPGYLVPLLISRPWSAATIVAESIVTYGIVWFCSERLTRGLGASSFFGRDRFFALVLTSVLVRVVADGWLWPWLGAALEARGYDGVDLRNNLQSFGLVIIALTANLFWKTGLLRGMVPLVTTVGITYLIVRYGLMEWTNFTVSGLSYMYEDVATSILASPKSYIILLTTAFIASRMNLVYGWDFNGILLPSLLALQWYQPQKVLATFAEALVILLAASALLRTRWFAGTTVEGGRKLLLFFNVGFAWKLLVGYSLPWLVPSAKVTDYFAFGYILSTLLAVKIHEKEILARLSRATLQTSLVAVALGSAIGFGLSLLPRLAAVGGGSYERGGAGAQVSAQALMRQVRDDKRLFYQARASRLTTPTALEIDRFTEGLSLLNDPAALSDPARQAAAAERVAAANFELLLLEGRYFYLRERQPARGYGIYVLNPKSTSTLVVEAPTAAAERGTAEAAASLFQSFDAAALALSGSRQTPEGGGDVLTMPHSMFHAFHRTLSRRNVLQVRNQTASLARKVAIRTDDASIHSSSLWIKNSLPPDLDLALLKQRLQGLELQFAAPPYVNQQRAETRGGFAELLLNRQGLRRLMIEQPRLDEVSRQVEQRRVVGYMAEWLLAPENAPAPRGSGAYVLPAVEELLFFDEEILQPLLRLMEEDYLDGRWTVDGEAELAQIALQLASYGYELIRYRDLGGGAEYLILQERPAAARRHWGTYLFRLGERRDYLVEIPRPVLEAGSLEYGASLFERLEAKALLVAGAHPQANADGSSDVLLPSNRQSLFSLVGQVLLRQERDRPQAVIQTRAFGHQVNAEPVDADVLMSVDDIEVVGAEGPAPLVDGLRAALQRDGLSVAIAGNSPASAGYDLGMVAQARYRQAAPNTRFISLRLSPGARLSFRQQVDNRPLAAQFDALGIPTETLDLREKLLGVRRAPGRMPAALLEATAEYQLQPDVVTLRRIQRAGRELRLQRILDRDTLAAFLWVADAEGRLMGVFNLTPRPPAELLPLGQGIPSADLLDRFLHGGLGGLLASERQ